MNRLPRILKIAFPALLALAMSVSPFVPPASAATGWTVTVGAESSDQGIQLAYFFPGDITVNQGDTVAFHFNTGEPHSVHFDAWTPNSTTLPAPTNIQPKGVPDLTWTFNNVGDFAYHCDLHTFMTGVVHVRAAGSAYPFTQAGYDQQSLVRQNQLMAEGLATRANGLAQTAQAPGTTNIGAGIGFREGPGSVFVLRFLRDKLTVKVGDTVTWSNLDPEAPHTISMNLDLPDPFAALIPVGLDGAGHATVGSTTQQVNSGFLWAAPFPGLPPPAYVGTVFKITFTQPGTYNYHCELHDTLGMTGTVVVTPKS